MGDSTDKLDRAVGFETFYNAHYLRISGYVRRRVPEHEAADVIAQVFTVAWRRFEQVPPPPEDRLWLFGVARHSVADYRRSWLRRLRLHWHPVLKVCVMRDARTPLVVTLMQAVTTCPRRAPRSDPAAAVATLWAPTRADRGPRAPAHR
jgi:DNA-directed RNA polymerase specialized sigma24 family protein